VPQPAPVPEAAGRLMFNTIASPASFFKPNSWDPRLMGPTAGRPGRSSPQGGSGWILAHERNALFLGAGRGLVACPARSLARSCWHIRSGRRRVAQAFRLLFSWGEHRLCTLHRARTPHFPTADLLARNGLVSGLPCPLTASRVSRGRKTDASACSAPLHPACSLV
jgi:hypothetical protein